jgi:D-xylose transport system substrate-binding protein
MRRLLGAGVAAVLLASQGAWAAAVKVGLLLPTQREERWVRDREAMIGEARRAGVELSVLVGESGAQQLAQSTSLISQGIKVLIVAPSDAFAAAVIVEKAHKAGVKVISYERLVVNTPLDFLYVSFDNLKVGALQGDFLVDRVPKGKYVLLAGSPVDNNAKLFREGAMKRILPLAEKGDIKVVLDMWVRDWKPSEAQRLCERVLSGARSHEIDAVLAPNDGTAGGCLVALAARGLAGHVAITGQDSEAAAAARVAQGTQSMTVFKDTRELARHTIRLAKELAEGKPVETGGRTVNNGVREVPAVLLTPKVVTKENLEATLIESGYLQREKVFGK